MGEKPFHQKHQNKNPSQISADQIAEMRQEMLRFAIIQLRDQMLSEGGNFRTDMV
ncbi:MAG: hypothetical protein OQL06_11540 [Gammaproteobacteria bacterium]|nr:hypothetical protein [Gammaproteobacteria bacterium]